jgi:hypothetical protein
LIACTRYLPSQMNHDTMVWAITVPSVLSFTKTAAAVTVACSQTDPSPTYPAGWTSVRARHSGDRFPKLLQRDLITRVWLDSRSMQDIYFAYAKDPPILD